MVIFLIYIFFIFIFYVADVCSSDVFVIVVCSFCLFVDVVKEISM